MARDLARDAPQPALAELRAALERRLRDLGIDPAEVEPPDAASRVESARLLADLAELARRRGRHVPGWPPSD